MSKYDSFHHSQHNVINSYFRYKTAKVPSLSVFTLSLVA